MNPLCASIACNYKLPSDNKQLDFSLILNCSYVEVSSGQSSATVYLQNKPSKHRTRQSYVKCYLTLDTLCIMRYSVIKTTLKTKEARMSLADFQQFQKNKLVMTISYGN